MRSRRSGVGWADRCGDAGAERPGELQRHHVVADAREQTRDNVSYFVRVGAELEVRDSSGAFFSFYGRPHAGSPEACVAIRSVTSRSRGGGAPWPAGARRPAGHGVRVSPAAAGSSPEGRGRPRSLPRARADAVGMRRGAGRRGAGAAHLRAADGRAMDVPPSASRRKPEKWAWRSAFGDCGLQNARIARILQRPTRRGDRGRRRATATASPSSCGRGSPRRRIRRAADAQPADAATG
jgi:hypothetical protein